MYGYTYMFLLGTKANLKFGTQKQTHRSMEQTIQPQNKPTRLWSMNLWQSRQEYTMEKRQSLQ